MKSTTSLIIVLLMGILMAVGMIYLQTQRFGTLQPAPATSPITQPVTKEVKGPCHYCVARIAITDGVSLKTWQVDSGPCACSNILDCACHTDSSWPPGSPATIPLSADTVFAFTISGSGEPEIEGSYSLKHSHDCTWVGTNASGLATAELNLGTSSLRVSSFATSDINFSFGSLICEATTVADCVSNCGTIVSLTITNE